MSQYQTIFSYGLWEIRQAPSGRLELWYKKEFVRGESRRVNYSALKYRASHVADATKELFPLDNAYTLLHMGLCKSSA